MHDAALTLDDGTRITIWDEVSQQRGDCFSGDFARTPNGTRVHLDGFFDADCDVFCVMAFTVL